MTDEKIAEQPGDVIETREVWSIQIQPGGGDYPWVEMGTPSADHGAILRTHDFRKEKFPEDGVRIVRADVKVTVEDPERLREIGDKKADDEGGTDVQSE